MTPGATATDNDPAYGTKTAMADISSVDITVVDVYEVTYTAPEDAAGNVPEPETRFVEVQDTTPPVINLNGDDSVTVELGDTYNEPGATVTDRDPDYAGTATASGAVNTSKAGDYTITYTADADGAGNEPDSITRTVTVQDTTKPVITLAGGQEITIELGDDYTEPGAAVTDNDPAYTTTAATVGGDMVDVNETGTYTITYTAPADDANNEPDSITRTVTVQDTTKPVIALTGDQDITIELGDDYDEKGATVSDNDPDYEETVTVSGMVNASKAGTYTITYTAPADESTNSPVPVERTVTVQDTTKPVITLAGGQEITIELGDDYTEPGAAVTDNDPAYTTTAATVGGDMVDVNETGTYTITYTAPADDANNEPDSITRTVTVQDTTKPVIELIGEPSVTVELGITYNDPGATVTDNDPDYAGTVTTAGEVDTGMVGEYMITYTAPADAQGNMPDSVRRTVSVQDSTAPVITVTGGTTVQHELGSPYYDQGAVADDGSAVTTDESNVNINKTGDYMVRYEAIDGENNRGAATRTVQVRDTTPPTISLNGQSKVTVVLGNNYTEQGASVFDNDPEYATTNATVGGDEVDANTDGVYTVRYTAPADAEGNVPVPVTRTVTVQNTPPSATNIVISVAAGLFVDYSPVEMGSVSDLQTPADDLVISIADANSATKGTVAVLGDSQTMRYAANSDATGSDDFDYVVTDAGGLTDTATVTVSIVENLAPEIEDDPAFMVAEGATLSETITITDDTVPNNGLIFTLDGSEPLNMTVGLEPDSNTNALFEWQAPAEVNAESYAFNLTVSDSVNSVIRTVTVNINEVNEDPAFDALLPQTAIVGIPYMLDLNATDSDLPAQTITYSIVDNLTPAAEIDEQTGVITWTPNTEGQQTIKVSASDDSDPASAVELDIPIAVNANDAPMPPATIAFTVAEGEQLSETIAITDSDAPSGGLTFSLDNNAPSDLTVKLAPGSKTNAMIAWNVPTEVSETSYEFDLTVSDGVNNVTRAVAVNINEVNMNPVITNPDAQTAIVGIPFSLDLDATDTDRPEQTITYSIVTNVTPSAEIDPQTGVITWTPKAQGQQTITVRATDNFATPGTHDLDIVISVAANDAPRPPATIAFTVAEGAQLSETITITDSDAPDGGLTFTLDGSKPADLTVKLAPGSKTNAALEWTVPAEVPETSYEFDLTISDGVNSVTRAINVTITEVNANPVLASPGAQDAIVGVPHEIDLDATDSDLPAQDITYSIVANIDPAASIDPQTGVITWTPDAQGQQTIKVQASDDFDPAGTVELDIPITVNANDAPRPPATIAFTVAEGAQLSETIAITDSDAPAGGLTFTLDGSEPSGLTVAKKDGSDTDALIEWQAPPEVDVESYEFELTVSDGVNYVNRTVTVSITEVNANPVLASPGAQDAIVGIPLELDLGATDSDLPAQTITYSIVANIDPAASIDPQTGVITWTPKAQGQQTITVRATDNFATPGTHDLDIVISVAANDAPRPPATIAFTVAEGAQLSETITITDSDAPDGGLTFTLDGSKPADLTVKLAPGSKTNAALEWTVPAEVPETSYEFDLTISDGVNSVTRTVNVSITEINQNPEFGTITRVHTIPLEDMLNLPLTATDDDRPEQALAYSITVQPTPPASIEAGNILTWDPASLGNQTITVTVADDFAPPGTDSIDIDVRVVDILKPVISLNGLSDITLELNDNYTEHGAAVSDNDPNYGTTEAAVGGDAVNTSMVGVYTVTYTAPADAAGHAPDPVTRTVTVQDTGAPVITLNGDNPLRHELGTSYTDPGAATNDGSPVIINASAVNVTKRGDYTVRISATDNYNNTGIITRTVEVRDTTKPIITLSGSLEITLELGSAYKEQGASVSDNDPAYSATVTISEAVNANAVGRYVVTYAAPADNAGNEPDEVTRTVIIQDTIAPIIALSGDNPLQHELGESYTDPGSAANDGTPVVTDASAVNITASGNYTVIYTADDGHGNVGMANRTVHVRDAMPPLIVLEGQHTITIELGNAYAELGANVTDNDPAYATTKAAVGGDTVDTSSVGVYTITYTAPADAAGNAPDPATRTVTVQDTGAPVITLSGDNPLRHELGDPYTDPGATTDDGSTVIIDDSAVNVNARGDYAVLFNATDKNDNTGMITRTVEVRDTTKPVITLNGEPGITLELDAAYDELGANVTDNDPNYGTTAATVGGDTVNTSTVGVYTITYTAPADAAGNAPDPATRTVTVQDTGAPQITLNGANPLRHDLGDPYTDPGATTDDGSTVIIDASAVNASARGDYTVNFSATDENGNTGMMTRTVEVRDTTKPVISLSGEQTVTVELGGAYTELGAAASDNDPAYNGTATPSGAVNTSKAGDYTITYNAPADDASNEPDSITRTVTVQDTTKPVIILSGPPGITLELGDLYAELGASVSDNDPNYGTTAATVGGDTVNTSTVGVYTITYTAPADDAGNAPDAVTRTVTVQDTGAPQITLTGDNPLRHELGDPYTDPGATTDDGSTAIIDASAVNASARGDYTVSFNATDENGNTGMATRTVEVRDTTKPVITLIGPTSIILQLGDSYDEQGANVTDNDPAYAAASATAGGDAVNTTAAGIYTVTYTAPADDAGNLPDPASRIITVQDTDAPVITLSGANPMEHELGQPYEDPGAATDDGSPVAADASAVNVNMTGDYEVTYTATDSSNNTGTAVRTVQVRDTTPPVITITGDNPLTHNLGDAYADPGAAATDNDPAFDGAVTANSSAVDVNATGNYTVTYTATDSSNNTGTAARTVHVRDTAPPIFESATLNENTGEMTITFDETIDISAASLGLLHVSDTGQADEVAMAGAGFDNTAADSATISMTLSQTHLDQIVPMTAPQLDIAAGAVSDLKGNLIESAADNPVTVTFANIPPAAPPASAATAEDTPVIIFPAISDADGGTPRISAVDDPANGTATFNNSSITYMPAQDFNGTDSFNYTATDGQDDSHGIVTVKVARDNRAPVLAEIGNQTVDVGMQLSITPAVTDGDPTDTHTYALARGTLPAEAVFTESDGTLAWTPVQENAGDSHAVVITVHDGRGGADSAAFTITVSDRDTAAPVITITGDNPLQHELGEPYEDPGAAADDGSPVSVDASQVNINEIGDYVVTYAATDSSNNTGTASRTVQVRDTTPPAFESAFLDRNTGLMTMTFDEPVDISETNLALLYVSSESQASRVGLSSAGLDRTAADSALISITLEELQASAILSMANPQLDIESGAVADLAGNEIAGISGLPVAIIGGTAPAPDERDEAPLPPEPRPARSGGGGGSRGGGSVPSASDESVGLYSVMWNCNEPATTVILDSDLTAEITLIANSESFAPAPDVVQNLDGRTAYTANSYAGIMLLKVTADGGSSLTKTINTLGSCSGQLEYAQYVPDPIPALPEPEPQPPAERTFTPMPVPVQEQEPVPEPDPEPAPASDPDCGPNEVIRDGECVPRPITSDADDGGCLIATAAYGTELAPQVQMLRELRDGTLLSTESGASFMDTFNSAYYAFSPAIADMQRENPAFRDAVRTLITPMIHSLSIMPLADYDSEGSVLALGILVIALNLGMYATAPTVFAIVMARRLRRS